LTADGGGADGLGMPTTTNHRSRPVSDSKPTGKQLAYLRSLAQTTGRSFVYPRTRAEASEQIRRLRGVRGNGMTIAELEAENETRALITTPR
jgi:hypothetical protein